MNVDDLMPASGLLLVVGDLVCPVLIDSGATVSMIDVNLVKKASAGGLPYAWCY